jgi:thymidylate synthase (FAD)
MVQVLDLGSVELIETMGSDAFIARIARGSTKSKFKGAEADKRLIERLVRLGHTSPLEFAEIVLHIKAPIFVARQWLRHRTANVSEVSGRYTAHEGDFYLIPEEQVQAQSSINKQSSFGILPQDTVDHFLEENHNSACGAFFSYYEALSKGVARETARQILPLSVYTEWYWKIDAHNLMHFLRLRTDEHAQWEIRQYAIAIEGIFAEWLPLVHGAYVKKTRRDRYAEKHFWNAEDYQKKTPL